MDSLQIRLVLYPDQQNSRVGLRSKLHFIGLLYVDGTKPYLRLIYHVEELCDDGHAAAGPPQPGEKVVVAGMGNPPSWDSLQSPTHCSSYLS